MFSCSKDHCIWINLSYDPQTRELIEDLRSLSGVDINMQGRQSRLGADSNTLIRILCHRSDSEASQFLKKQYKLPKSSAWQCSRLVSFTVYPFVHRRNLHCNLAIRSCEYVLSLWLIYSPDTVLFMPWLLLVYAVHLPQSSSCFCVGKMLFMYFILPLKLNMRRALWKKFVSPSVFHGVSDRAGSSWYDWTTNLLTWFEFLPFESSSCWHRCINFAFACWILRSICLKQGKKIKKMRKFDWPKWTNKLLSGEKNLLPYDFINELVLPPSTTSF